MTKFLLIRHGTNDTVGKSFGGRLPSVHLNEEGKQQAVELAQRLKHLPIKAIYCSPMERTIETATPLANELSLPLQTSHELIEIDCRNWTGKEIEALKNDKAFHLFNSFRSIAAIPGGEWMLDAQIRVVRFLQCLCKQHVNETIAIVSHADIIKAAIAYYAGMPLDFLLRIEIDPASVSIINVYEESVQIQVLNHTGNL